MADLLVAVWRVGSTEMSEAPTMFDRMLETLNSVDAVTMFTQSLCAGTAAE